MDSRIELSWCCTECHADSGDLFITDQPAVDAALHLAAVHGIAVPRAPRHRAERVTAKPFLHFDPGCA